MIFDLLKKGYFKQSDVKVIKSFEYNPNAEILYEVLKGYIYWDDEMIFGRGLSKHGYHRIINLLEARCLLYHDPKQPNQNGLDKDYYIKIWRDAYIQIPNWPGFHSDRLVLSREQWRFYQESLKNP